VACRFHLEDHANTETLQELSLRARVARLPETARRSGQVRIEIQEPEAIDVELSRRVHIRFSLAHSIDRRERRGAR
jgi:DNA-binding transcriptional regulator LsrR (DeoR family)